MFSSNIFITTVSNMDSSMPAARRKRMSEPVHNTNTGGVYVALSDGRYLKKIIGGTFEVGLVFSRQISKMD